MKIVYIVTEDKAFLTQRLNLALNVLKDGNEVHVLSNKSELAHKISELGFIYHHSKMKRLRKNPLNEFFSILHLYKTIKNIKPDIVHGISIKPVIYGSIAARLASVPCIVATINGLGYVFVGTGLKKRLLRMTVKFLYKIALSAHNLRVIFQNPDDQAEFIRWGIVKKDKTTVILGSGVDTNKFSFVPLSKNERPKVLFFSRMLWDKGVKYLIDSTRELKQTQKLNFEMVFAGSPDPLNPRSISKEQLSKWAKEGLISYLGQQSDIPSLIAESDIVCLPTYYREGVPLSLIESASVGRPIITTRMPGCKEIVLHNENGLIVTPKCTQELTDALKVLITRPDLRIKMGQKGRERVELHFSQKVINQKTKMVYKDFLVRNS